jgi:transposase-like protein
MEDSPIGLDKWLPAIWMICGCKNGISSYEIARDLGVSRKTAWFILHRVRLAMKSGTIEKLSGEIEADETFVGGKVRNMHKARRIRAQKFGRNTGGKTMVVGLLERDGQVRAAVAPSRHRHQVHSHIIDNVETGSKLYTDEFMSYENLPEGITREFVNHLEVEAYVQGRVHTNGMENFWSLLKRTLKGTYISVDPVPLQAYVDEQAYRFNNRLRTWSDSSACCLRSLDGVRRSLN